MNNATFPLIAFTSDTVSRLTGLTIRQIHYWDRNGFFTPAFADPHQRRPHSLVYTFVDLVGLRTIAELRTQGVTWPTLKRLRSVFQTADNVDWAKRKFYVVGRNAYFTHDEAIIAARPLGQSVLPTVLEIGPIAQSMERAVQSLPERGANQFGKITRDRLIMNGKDIISGTRIPTETISWFHANGYDLSAIQREFPRLVEADILAAIDHEKRKRQPSTDPLAGAG